MAKVAFIIAKNGFRDEEFLVPYEILKEKGHQISVVSNTNSFAIGAGGTKLKVDLNIKELDPENFDLIVFVGGPGALENLDNEISYNICRKTIQLGKKLAAICISPVILAKSGVLKSKRATVWSSPVYKEPIEILKNQGAIYLEENVVQDEKIVTANGPHAAEEFGKKLLSILEE